MKAVLGLEDGTFVAGNGFGVEGICSGELVFTTQMTGYMEALTDPGYAGQLLMFTYPLIGNYGVDRENFESRVFMHGAALCARSPACPPCSHRLQSFSGRTASSVYRASIPAD